LALGALPACSKRPAEPPAPERPAVVVVGPSESMSVNDDSIPPPRLIPPAAEVVDPDSPDAIEIFAIAAEKGSWKFQYPSGERERNELHLLAGRPVRFTLTAEQEILFGLGWRHLEVPAFPFVAHAYAGRYTQAAVLPKRAGAYGLWNASGRIGTVYVLEAADFTRWRSDEPGEPGRTDNKLAYEGRQLFLRLQCIRCHTATQTGKAPVLEGLYGTKVLLKGGGSVLADDAYIVESIRKPKAKVVDGWEAIMPAYDEKMVSEAQMNALVAYIKSLARRGPRTPPPEK
jgi:cytochrome c oxidase subunit 2